MAKKIEKSNLGIDVIAFFLALFYMQSVLTVAHHTSMWAHNGTTHTVQSPAVPLLIIGLIVSGYSWQKKKGVPSPLIIISLTIFATASLFWLSGLRTNFYF